MAKTMASRLALATVGLACAAAIGAGGSWGARASDYSPRADSNSMDSTTRYTGAQDWWNAGYTGRGVDVAVIDSGVAPVAGLDDPRKVVHGPDLSLESQAPNLTGLDTFGHGTFMSGLIAAHGDDYRGMAPGARIISLKVASADGGADVSQVIAAIDWVVQHAHDPGLNIRVLNLSYGTNSRQSYLVDPLAYAAEQAWKKGIVVVAAAGNSGYQRDNGAHGLADPAYDPYLLAVGGSDSMGTLDRHDDVVGEYSAGTQSCPRCRQPDLVAPGSHLQGLRVPNSFIDAHHPDARIGDRYFRGTGTSEAAAIVSGAVALVLQRYPGLSPDQVKHYFERHATRLQSVGPQVQGAGLIDLASMLHKEPQLNVPPQRFDSSTGLGLLELSRGQDHLTRDSVVLSAERDIFGKPWSSALMAAAEAAGSSWSGGMWNGSSWSGSSWSGSSWSSSSWSGSSWSGSSWSGSSWSGSSWSGSSWSGSSWSGSSWSGSSWSGSSWSGSSWSAASWS
jgi:serine protease AprX